MTQPLDHAVRQRAVSESRTSFAISAGAGSGKTRVLVDRLVQHLLDGVPPDRIAAITFTEKAAGELSGRARDALELALAEADPGSPAAEAARSALDRFGELTLSTIHSFCQGLLRQEPLEAGWAPDSEIIGDLPDPSLEACYQSWREGFDLRHPEVAPLLRELANESSFQPGVASIRGAAAALLDNRDLRPLVAGADAGLDWAVAASQLLEIIAEMADAASACTNAGRCKLYAKGAPLLEQLAGLRELGAQPAVQAALDVEAVKPGRIGSKKDWPGDSKTRFIGAVNAFGAWKEDTQRAIGERLHRLLIEDLQEHYVPAVLAARASAARADYADLLFRARSLLADRAAARARLAEQYRVLLVDEVQDTDPIQAEVAALLSRPAGASGDWDAVAPLAGSLFAVGDPRQSIYRFRRADVATWAALQALIARDGDTLRLQQNFRSVPGIVDWVRHTFPDAEQVAWREPAALPPVSVLRCPDKDHEIEAAAAYLRRLLDDPAAQIVDPEDGQLRRVRPGDIMVLLPSWSSADDIQDRLQRAEIPAAVEGDSRLFSRDEGRLALEALRCLSAPSDAAATLSVLRGLFGFSHAALAAHRAAEGGWNYTWAEQPDTPVAEALAVLRRLHGQRGARSWAALLDELLAETGADALWALTGRRWQALANLDKIRALLRQAEATARSPLDAVEALEQLARSGQSELPILDEDADAVRVTTYFKAKGLEAPVVLLVRASRRLIPPPAIVLREQGALAVQAGRAVCPPRWDAIRDAEKAALSEERRRWMYVAVTRARDHLVMVDSKHATLIRGTLSDGLAGVAAASHEQTVSLAAGVEVQVLDADRLPAAPDVRATFPGLDGDVDRLLAQPPAGGADSVAVEQARADREAIKAAKLAGERFRHLGRPQQASRWSGGPRSAAVHRALHRLDLSRPVSEAQASAALLAETDALSPDEQRWCAEVLRGYLAHPAVQGAAHAARVFQPMPTMGEDYGTALAGDVDLCYATDPALKRWTVVDWQVHLQRGPADFFALYPRRLKRLMSRLLAEAVGATDVTVHVLQPSAAVAPSEDEQAEALLEIVHEDLLPLARWLVAQGDVPEASFDVGEDRVLATLELAWPASRRGVGLDLPEPQRQALAAAGWRVVCVDTAASGWVAEVEEAVRSQGG